MKHKGGVFKKNKAELNALRTERGIIARTADIVSSKDRDITEILKETEADKGIAGYFAMREERRSGVDGSSESAEESDRNTEDLTATIKKLSDLINKTKEKAHASACDLRPLRQKAFDLQNDYDTHKSSYDSTAAGLESTLNKIKVEVKKLQEELQSLESSSFRAHCDLEVVNAFESLLMTKEPRQDLGEAENKQEKSPPSSQQIEGGIT